MDTISAHRNECIRWFDFNRTLQVRFTDEYPSLSPPYFELDAVNLTGADRHSINTRLHSAYSDNIGEAVVYIWVEEIRDYINNLASVVAEDVVKVEKPPSRSENEIPTNTETGNKVGP